MEERLLEVSRVAKKLSLDESTIRRMFHKGILKGIRTGASGTRIRIFESSVMQHIQSNTGIESNTGTTY